MSVVESPSGKRPGPSRTAAAVGVVLVTVLAAAVVVASRVIAGDPDVPRAERGPLPLVPVDAPAATSQECVALAQSLPTSLTSAGTTLNRLQIADPAPPGAVAWGAPDGEPVVLRCGLGKPPELTPTSPLRAISGVQWLPVEGPGSTTWFVVDRTVYVALTLPGAQGTGPLQSVSETVRNALAPIPVRP